MICSFLRDKITIVVASFFISRPFSCVSSTFSLTENFDQPLFYPVTQHPPQTITRVSAPEQGGVDVVPPFLDVPHILGRLYHEAVGGLRERSVTAGPGQLVVHQPAGQGGAPGLSSGAAGACQAAVKGGVAATGGELQLERRGRALRPVHDAVLRPRAAPHKHGVALGEGRRGRGGRGRRWRWSWRYWL